MAEFIQREKDRPILLMDGFLYVKDKQVRSKVYWKCQHFAEMLVFSTENNLTVLASCKHYFMDGTFKTMPVIFDQLYTIHGMKNGYVIPLVYALLPNKRQETYSNFLRTVKTIAPTLDVESVNTDFEPAIVKAIKEELPSSNHYGCFLHLCQCVYRKCVNSASREGMTLMPSFR